MLRPRQPDLFGPAPAPSYLPDPDKIRSKLLGVLAKARAAPEVPWSPKDADFYRTVFPQMATWLPDDEAARLRREFAAELARLEAF